MTDLLLDWNTSGADLLLRDGDLAKDPTLVSSVMVSLFTDARADQQDLPAGETDRRGWWGDSEANRIGSLLWLDRREKETDQAATKIARHCKAALSWMVDEGIVEIVDVAASFISRGLLAVEIELKRGRATGWAQAWEAAESVAIEDQGLRVNLVLT